MESIDATVYAYIMANIRLDIDNAINRITLKAMIEADGHTMVETDPDVILSDDLKRAVGHGGEAPVIILTTVADIRDAVETMRKGVYGYIIVPFLPGETSLMIDRALNTASDALATEEDTTPASLKDVEARHILDTLRYCKNNQAKAARLLGIGRNTLWRKLKLIKDKTSE